MNKHTSRGELQAEAQKLFTDLNTRFPETQRLKEPHFVRHDALRNIVSGIGEDAEALAEDEERNNEERARARRTLRLASTLASRLDEAIALADANKVYWLERDAKERVRLRAKPLDVSELLSRELFGKTRSVVLTSATLTTAGTFDFVRRELGRR